VADGIKGGIFGTNLGLGDILAARRRYLHFHRLRLPIMALGGVLVIVLCIEIGAEKAGKRFGKGVRGVTAIEERERTAKESR
jgi:hypothetical protein